MVWFGLFFLDDVDNYLYYLCACEAEGTQLFVLSFAHRQQVATGHCCCATRADKTNFPPFNPTCPVIQTLKCECKHSFQALKPRSAETVSVYWSSL